MPLSANSLFHFTSGSEQLRGILSDNFKLSYCKESVQIAHQPLSFYVPMVSFCDIPLSEIKAHISKYGTYGIGMTRDWGLRKGLNPVLYLEQQSLLSQSFQTAMSFFFRKISEDSSKLSIDSDYAQAFYALTDISGYVKNYENDLSRGATTIPSYRFSDEREWRYVPKCNDEQHWLQPGTSKDDISPQVVSKLDTIRLDFEPNDIKYIIIRDDSEIGDFVNHLRFAKRKYAHEDVERLTTRILTAKQIYEDV
jgi:Putative abortive phage resistance protein AbiGi, antitoxin